MPKTKKAKANSNNAKKSSNVKKAKPNKTKKRSEEIMDRSTLKSIASKLKDAGSSIKVMKNDTDADLQKKVNEAVHQLPGEEVLAKLDSIDPVKLVKVLKKDCFGIFVDFSQVECVRCADASMCVGAFIGNLRSGFVGVQSANTESAAVKEKAKPATVSAVTRYEPGRLVFVRDVPNPNPEGDDLHDTIQRVLRDQPETLKELRDIVEQDFDLENDGDFMKFVTALRDPAEGVLKLDVDLSDKDKAALRKAGYEI